MKNWILFTSLGLSTLLTFANVARPNEKSSKSEAPFVTKASKMDFEIIHTSKPKTIKVRTCIHNQAWCLFAPFSTPAALNFMPIAVPIGIKFAWHSHQLGQKSISCWLWIQVLRIWFLGQDEVTEITDKGIWVVYPHHREFFCIKIAWNYSN